MYNRRICTIIALFFLFIPKTHAALPLGSVVDNGPVGCPPGSTSGSTCEKLTITCPNTNNLAATVSLVTPGSNLGTIVSHSGTGGTSFFFAQFTNQWLSDGYRESQIVWASDWEDTGSGQTGSIVTAACRPATVIDWIHTNYHTEGASKPFCFSGFSAGAAAGAMSLAYYGIKSEITRMQFLGGPAISDTTKGCTTTGTVQVCPGFNAVYNYPNRGTQGVINNWSHTTTCSNPPYAPADQTIWSNESITSTNGADFNYPTTTLSGFFCPAFNEAAGQGALFINQVTSSLGTLACTANCNSEAYWLDINGQVNTVQFAQVEDDMTTYCTVPAVISPKNGNGNSSSLRILFDNLP